MHSRHNFSSLDKFDLFGLDAVQFANPRSAHRALKAASVFSFAPRTDPTLHMYRWRSTEIYSAIIGSLTTYSKSRFALVY